MYLQSILVLIIVLNSTVVSPYTFGALKPAFVTTGQGAPASCNAQQEAALRTNYREALEAVRMATQAIDNLKKSQPLVGNKKKTWKRQSQLLKALFNIDVGKKLSQGNTNATIVRENFQRILDGLDYGNPNLPISYWVFCGDDWLQWRDPAVIAEIDPQTPKRTVGQIYGMYLTNVITPNKRMQQYTWLGIAQVGGAVQGGAAQGGAAQGGAAQGRAVQGPHPMCGAGQDACTISASGAVTFCGRAFTTGNSLAATKSSISTGDTLDSKRTLAHLWIHELCHLLNRCKSYAFLRG
ncbi:MAG: hypothetical protein Q9169_008155 [Polycauliona sp. 2 TL-2023]